MKKIIPKIIGFAINFIGLIDLKLASKWALYLFSKPMKGRYKTAHPILEKANQSTLNYNGISIKTYYWKGEKETVLLAHGWESNTARWSNTIVKLQKLGYGIVALDAPAHGHSGSPTFNAILYSNFIKEVYLAFNPRILVGHSVGGMAISFFLKNNSTPSVKKIILLGAPAGFVGIFNTYTNLMGFNRRLQKGIEALIKASFGHPSSYFNTANFLKNTDIQGLIIHDQKDKIIPYSDAEEINSKYVNSTLVTTTGYGHGLKSKQVLDTIINFIAD